MTGFRRARYVKKPDDDYYVEKIKELVKEKHRMCIEFAEKQKKKEEEDTLKRRSSSVEVSTAVTTMVGEPAVSNKVTDRFMEFVKYVADHEAELTEKNKDSSQEEDSLKRRSSSVEVSAQRTVVGEPAVSIGAVEAELVEKDEDSFKEEEEEDFSKRRRSWAGVRKKKRVAVKTAVGEPAVSIGAVEAELVEKDEDSFKEEEEDSSKRRRSWAGVRKKKRVAVKTAVGEPVVSNEVTDRLKEFITGEKKGRDLKLVIQKKLYASDLEKGQNRLSMPVKQLQTEEFVTAEERRRLERGEEFEVELLGPRLRMHGKAMVLKMWHMVKTNNYVLKTNWNEFKEENKEDLKENTLVQVWSFRQDDGRLCLALACV